YRFSGFEPPPGLEARPALMRAGTLAIGRTRQSSQAFRAGRLSCPRPCSERANASALGRDPLHGVSRGPARSARSRQANAAASSHAAGGGAVPTAAAAELLDRANFHEYNFFVIVRQRTSREDDYDSTTRGTWLRHRAAAGRLNRERARHRQDRADQ